MTWTVLIILAIVVVVGAYLLGTYVRGQQDAPRSGAPVISAPARGPVLRVAAPRDREVKAVVAWLLSQAFEQTGVKVSEDRLAYQRIIEAAEKAVQQVKTEASAEISLPYLTADVNGPKHLTARLTREMVDELVKY